MQKQLTACALATLLLAAPAIAQETTPPADPVTPTMTDPAAPDAAPAPGGPATDPMAPAAPAPVDPVTPADPVTPSEPVSPEGPDLVDGFISGQSADQILSSNILNVEVVGADNEGIGSVDDILIDRAGNVLGIVVGVGGFLGIGTHDVAIPINAVEFVLASEVPDAAPAGDPMAPAPADPAVAPAPAAPGDPMAPAPADQPGTGWGWWDGDGPLHHIRVDFTREQLEAAPEFSRADD